MKNLTITMSEELLARLRVQAAQQGMSLSRFAAEVLCQQLGADSAYEDAKRRYFANRFEFRREPGERYLTREEAHDRAGLRRL